MNSLLTRAGTLDFSQGPLLMGIINVTPDSFSDGGQCLRPEDALDRAETLVEEGAALLDVGGESTRPGAAPVSVEEELSRVRPVVERLAQRLPRVPISVDTSKAAVARACLEGGASLINDVTALEDPAMPSVLREHGVPVVLMHMRGNPRTMQTNPIYTDVVQDLLAFFRERIAFAEKSGLARNHLLIDPGFGFGKTTAHNLQLLGKLSLFRDLGLPVVAGLSRKSFIGRLLGGEETPLPPADREAGSLAANLRAAQEGAAILRVHNVKDAARALQLFKALR
ncbi:MAG: dihydropteroate synthase [Elusimicrobia bacterium]|nr:dihydropteroate synthase [Elusimicrobiota bacterium]